MELKKEIIGKRENGVRISDLAMQYDIVKLIICTIIKNKEASKAANVAKGVTILMKHRSQVMKELTTEEMGGIIQIDMGVHCLDCDEGLPDHLGFNQSVVIENKVTDEDLQTALERLEEGEMGFLVIETMLTQNNSALNDSTWYYMEMDDIIGLDIMEYGPSVHLGNGLSIIAPIIDESGELVIVVYLYGYALQEAQPIVQVRQTVMTHEECDCGMDQHPFWNFMDDSLLASHFVHHYSYVSGVDHMNTTSLTDYIMMLAAVPEYEREKVNLNMIEDIDISCNMTTTTTTTTTEPTTTSTSSTTTTTSTSTTTTTTTSTTASTSTSTATETTTTSPETSTTTDITSTTTTSPETSTTTEITSTTTMSPETPTTTTSETSTITSLTSSSEEKTTTILTEPPSTFEPCDVLSDPFCISAITEPAKDTLILVESGVVCTDCDASFEGISNNQSVIINNTFTEEQLEDTLASLETSEQGFSVIETIFAQNSSNLTDEASWYYMEDDSIADLDVKVYEDNVQIGFGLAIVIPSVDEGGDITLTIALYGFAKSPAQPIIQLRQTILYHEDCGCGAEDVTSGIMSDDLLINNFVNHYSYISGVDTMNTSSLTEHIFMLAAVPEYVRDTKNISLIEEVDIPCVNIDLLCHFQFFILVAGGEKNIYLSALKSNRQE
ncbi:hypothetical protein SK128_015555 [Halocaridina rubra]|uniref:Uncharacterized protein n=1 Tax=Halocaridina rubra TaxID=373956 RepID=A0AAN8WVW5_HALRR